MTVARTYKMPHLVVYVYPFECFAKMSRRRRKISLVKDSLIFKILD